jgi:hypothetical protein
MATTDIDVGAPVTGQFTANVFDPGGAPANVIRRSQAWEIRCEWFIDGGLASSLGGRWELSAALEALGPGAELVTPTQVIALDGRTGPGTPYSGQIAFPANSINLGGAQKVPFKVVALLNYDDVAGNPGPMAASVDLGVIHIYA